MATGTIDAQEIGNGSGPVTLTKQSAAKAWVNFNGTGTAAVSSSQNISGLIDNGTGDYVISFTTSFVDGNYSPGGFGARTTTTAGNVTAFGKTNTQLAGSLAVVTTDLSTVVDCAIITLSIHGDLAT